MMKKELSINERILYLIENQVNGNQKKFAEKINFAPQVVYNIVSGRKSKPSFDVLNAILSSFVYINAEWLLTGKGEMLKQPQGNIKETPPPVVAEGQSNNTEVALLRKQVALLEENRLLHQEIKQLQERINHLEQENYAIQKQLQNRAAG
ncbi:hypothetical protein [Riemerella anatipestifer]|uniref:hypothetical protein n=1 Tax=Riemerella anatipestifer TaxID=34085 RepID=UPI00129EA03E|nr:hypothetical protein [Riemerella anatipestifer]MBT0551274.1 hypothetical protein [Riemerella anatipestifer]MBT0552870.1 hypothetical protein [Riemerella anatipestifer]MCE3023606.1 hypothetical protein [Riemerella anatipestifer]MCU7558807.1 hypothetical protein [Riemerella anatipestifer]MCW0512160.1 hypothetical protein [Riemerella anatipestifer]